MAEYLKDTAEIREREDGSCWELSWQSGEPGGEFPAAVLALEEGVRGRAARLFDAGRASILGIDWYPSTKIGQQVVEVLAGQGAGKVDGGGAVAKKGGRV